MAVKVFIIGLPGSGKSKIARQISKHIKRSRSLYTQKHWCIKRFNDYSILYTMFRDDNQHKRFVPAEPAELGGFNVIDFSAFDDALKSLERWITQDLSASEAKAGEIVLIEFARNNYRVAFQQFSEKSLQDAYFIYLGAEVGVCKQRIRDRVSRPEYTADDYHVSDLIFKSYYHSDDGQSLARNLEQDYGIDRERVLMLENNGSLEAIIQEIYTFINHILAAELTDVNLVRQTEQSETLLEDKRPQIMSIIEERPECVERLVAANPAHL